MVSNSVQSVAGRLRGRRTPILDGAPPSEAGKTRRQARSNGTSGGRRAAVAGAASVGDVDADAASAAAAAATADRLREERANAARSFADEPTDVLLARYRCRPASQPTKLALRDELVERHRAIVESMAHLLAARLPPSVDPQDLVHAGIWGLMQAIDSYQPERCDQFTAFLRIRVRGAMLDELRHMDFLPRLYRRRLREREAARAMLSMRLEREPTASELAAELGISEAALLRRFEPSLVRTDRDPDRGDEPGEVDSLADDQEESPIEAIHRQDLLNLVRAHLEPMEWKVLQLHYLEGMTGKQVARRLRLSAARICQIHGRVLDRLKAQLAVGELG